MKPLSDIGQMIDHIVNNTLSANQHPLPFSLTYERSEGGGEMIWAVYIEAEAQGKPRYDLITQALDPVTALRNAQLRLSRELSW